MATRPLGAARETATGVSPMAVCVALTSAIGRSGSVEQIYDAALDALADGLGVSRAAILLFDPDGVMRFKAHRRLSEDYRRAVEGHTPWAPDSPDPQAIVVGDVSDDPSLAPYLPTLRAEGIAAMTFIPLVTMDRVIGKFMVYSDIPRVPGGDELQLAGVVAAQVAFAVGRQRAEEEARRNEGRLRFALHAAQMGTWDWDIATNVLRWSENLEQLHGLPQGTFDGTFASYAREIHPDDRERVHQSVRRALADGVPHDVEYRIVAPDGTVRWVEGKGRVEYDQGRPSRMTGVCMMVTRRKEAEQARLEAAEEASRLKDDFLATLSHELRTPLGAILGWVQVVQSGEPSPDRVRQAIDVIGRNARHQARLIEDILDVSRIITGKFEIAREPVEMLPLLDTVIGSVHPLAAAKRIELTRSGCVDAAVTGDAKRLHQVLSNVLSNAVTFTPEGGRIDVRSWHDGSALTLEVQDSGIGIDQAFLPYVFDRFRQADSRSTRRHGGLGLGLAIARHLIEQHGGDIRVESGGVGQGTTIALRLPLRAAPDAAGRTDEFVAATAPQVAPPLLPGTTIVVVDDDGDSRDVLSALLDGTQAEIVPCDSAAAALAALDARAVDLLIADLAMPDVDGYELMGRVAGTWPALPAIAVSAFARPEDRGKALLCGYRAYCAKPVDQAQLLDAIRTVLRSGDGHR